ncbi:CWC16 protein [Lipomyces tetrasporus]
MAERKIINKYFPPNFDPSKITRKKRSAGDKDVQKLQTVRLMTPFSMKCTSCGEYIYKGKKFNARKENTGEKYLGISILRFHIRCTRCAAEITFKTDPKNSDYVSERGAARNFEPWRDPENKEETEEERLDRLEKEEEENAMAELEAKVVDAKRQMEMDDTVDELRTRNAINEHVDPESVLDKIRRDQEEENIRQEQEDAELIRKAFANRSKKVVEFAEPTQSSKSVDGLSAKANPLDLLRKRKDARSSLGVVVKRPKVA